MTLLAKMIYLFAFDTIDNSMSLGDKIVYYNNIEHINDIEDWQETINKHQKFLTNE